MNGIHSGHHYLFYSTSKKNNRRLKAPVLCFVGDHALMLLHDPFYAFQSISVQGWIFLSCKESSVLPLWYLVRTVGNLHKKHLAALLDFYLDLPGGSFFPFPVFFPLLSVTLSQASMALSRRFPNREHSSRS